MTHYPKIQNCYKALKIVVPPNTVVPDCIRNVAYSVIMQELETCHHLMMLGDAKGSEDAYALLSIMREYKDTAFFLERYMHIRRLPLSPFLADPAARFACPGVGRYITDLHPIVLSRACESRMRTAQIHSRMPR